MINLSELRNQGVEILKIKLMELLRKQFDLRMQKMSGQMVQVHLLKVVRRDIARIKTILNEKIG